MYFANGSKWGAMGNPDSSGVSLYQWFTFRSDWVSAWFNPGLGRWYSAHPRRAEGEPVERNMLFVDGHVETFRWKDWDAFEAYEKYIEYSSRAYQNNQ